MIEELFSLERLASQESILHRIDARVKIIGIIAAIVAMVSVPFSPVVYPVGILFLVLVIMLWLISRLPAKIYVARLFTALPFGFMICGFQIFFTNRYYTEYHVLYALPFGINIFAESVEFASILLVKFFICFSFIIILSCTTTLQDLLEGAGRLKMPPDLLLALGMMIRYLFVFAYMSRKIHESLLVKCFDPFDRKLSYRYRITQLGYTLGTMFIRSFEQGERTYLSMLCRGYGRESHTYVSKKAIPRTELVALAGCICYIVAVPTICWLVYQH